jgi:phospholipid transport system transporter-binding protein
MPPIALPAEANLPQAAALAESLGRALDEALRSGPGPVELDASALQAVDTSTIALLLELGRRAGAAGRALRVTGAPPKLADLARLYGVHDLVLAG